MKKDPIDPIKVSQTFNASINRVWQAITQPDQMRSWYFPMIGEFEARLNFETGFTVHIEDRVFPHVWKVKEVDPLKKISYEWTFEGYPGKGMSLFELRPLQKDPTDQRTLKRSDTGPCELRLTFCVLKPFPDDVPEFKRESGVSGWNYLIRESLKAYLDG